MPSTSPSAAASFSWTNRWYAVAWAADVTRNRLVPFRLFGNHYVLFLDPSTNIYVAIDDVCPHRAAALSEGRLFQEDTPTGPQTLLECVYHGWQFNTGGTCVHIPNSKENSPIPKRAHLPRMYATSVSDFGLIFMWLGDRLTADDTLLPIPENVRNAAHHQGTFIRPMARRMPVGWQTLVENLADPSHVSFAHHGTSEGNRRYARGGDMHVVDRDHANCELRVSITRPVLGSVRVFVAVLSGALVHYTALRPDDTAVFDLMLYATPTAIDETSLFGIRVRYRQSRWYQWWRPRVPRWIDHAHNNLTLDGDTALIQWQEVELARGASPKPGTGEDKPETPRGVGTWRSRYVLANGDFDALVVEFRRWFDVAAYNMPFVRGDRSNARALQRLPRAHVNDRFHWHVSDCVSCMAALRALRAARAGAVVLSVVMVSTAMACAVCAGALQVGVTSDVGMVAFAMVRRRLRLWALGALIGAGAAVTAGLCAQRGVASLTWSDKAYRLQHKDD